MKLTLDRWGRYYDPMDFEQEATFIVLGFAWYRNGGWRETYDDGSRLFYVYFSLIVLGLEVRWLMDFNNRPESIP